MLFTFPSRYCSSIGHQVVFRLGWWSTRLPTGFHVSGGTLDTRSHLPLSNTGLSPSTVGLPIPFFWIPVLNAGPYPENPERLSVWPPPRSLATTSGISVDVFSCPYLDVSVQGVPLIHLFDSVYDTHVLHECVPTFGNLRIIAYLQLPEAYRSLSRPSSAPDAKAFPLCSLSLNLVDADFAHSVSAASLAAPRENCISLRRISSPKQNFVSFRQRGSQNYAGSFRILLRNCYPASPQAPYRSFCRFRQNSLIPLRLLFLANCHSLGWGRGKRRSQLSRSTICFTLFLLLPCLSFLCSVFNVQARVTIRQTTQRMIWRGGLKWTRTTDLTIISRVL